MLDDLPAGTYRVRAHAGAAVQELVTEAREGVSRLLDMEAMDPRRSADG